MFEAMKEFQRETGRYVRLQRIDSIVCLTGLLEVSAINEKGNGWHQRRQLKFVYESGQVITLHYGSDDGYLHETTCRDRRDEDFRQIEGLLFSDECSEGDKDKE